VLRSVATVAEHALPNFDWLLQPQPAAAPWTNAGQCCGGAAGL
jgi:hypothetical protein